MERISYAYRVNFVPINLLMAVGELADVLCGTAAGCKTVEKGPEI